MPVRFRQHYQKLSLGRRVALRALVPFTIVFIFLRVLTYTLRTRAAPQPRDEKRSSHPSSVLGNSLAHDFWFRCAC